jgi:hypothetical protein
MRTDRWKALLPELDKGLPGDAGQVGEVLTQERIEPVRRMIQAYDDAFVEEVTH